MTLDLVRIPAGTFMMGSPDTDRSRSPDEEPLHTVTISQDFYMGKTEVTQAQWLTVMGSWPGSAPGAHSGVGDDYPAYYVSWYDCQNFVTALNTHITNTDQGPATIRLPSEAEWEYACRAGTTTRFLFGDSLEVVYDISDGPTGSTEYPGNRSEYMWFDWGTSAYVSHPVGRKLPNAWGLHDMSGHVNEWCQDNYHFDYTDAPADGSAWLSSTSSSRMVHGKSHRSYARWCRSANRTPVLPDARINNYGFRLARTP